MTAAAAFVIAACLAVMWLPQALLSAAAVAALTVMYVTVFWKRIADATDRRAVAGLQEWIPRRPGSSRLPPQEAGDVLPEQLEIR